MKNFSNPCDALRGLKCGFLGDYQVVFTEECAEPLGHELGKMFANTQKEYKVVVNKNTERVM